MPDDALPGLLAAIGRVEPAGRAFPVFKLGPIDVALPRRESKSGRGHTGFQVDGDPSMSVADAARRRDFTINAISWDPLTGEYLDPFHGRDDLAARRLRVVDPRTFADDSLRVLRALQFAARFECALDDEARTICRAIALDDLPAERLWGEFEKLLLAAERPSIGFTLARDLGVVEQILPEMVPLYDCPQDPEWHPEGDVWTHNLLVIDEARRRNADLDRPRLATVMLAAVCHDLGKPATTAFVDGRWRSPGHEAAGVAPSARLLDRFKVQSMDGVRRARAGARHRRGTPAAERLPQSPRHGERRRLPPAGRPASTSSCWCGSGAPTATVASARSTVRRWTGSWSGPGHSVWSTRRRSRSSWAATCSTWASPGPRMGEILKAVYEQQLDGVVTTLDQAIETAHGHLGGRDDG